MRHSSPGARNVYKSLDLPHNLPLCQGGEFTRQAEVTFSPGNEKLTIRQEFKGIDEHDHLVVSTTLEGRVPEVPQGASVQIEPYSEIYQYSSNSKSTRPVLEVPRLWNVPRQSVICRIRFKAGFLKTTWPHHKQG